MNRTAIRIAAVLLAVGCRAETEISAEERREIAGEIHRLVVDAYDLSKPGAVNRLMSLYPRNGEVYSAGAGRVTSSRDSLERGIRAFWENVGSRMREPRWQWTRMQIDVPSRRFAVMTATYRVPHLTPAGQPHVIEGAWTAVFVKRGDRWEIVHEHLSDVPAGQESAAFDSTAADPHAGH